MIKAQIQGGGKLDYDKIEIAPKGLLSALISKFKMKPGIFMFNVTKGITKQIILGKIDHMTKLEDILKEINNERDLMKLAREGEKELRSSDFIDCI